MVFSIGCLSVCLFEQVEAKGVLIPTVILKATSEKQTSPLYKKQQTLSKHYYG